MADKRKQYTEGDWFAVPLITHGYAIGVIARLGEVGHGTLFGYFFGLRFDLLPSSKEIAELTNFSPNDAIFSAIFGDIGIVKEHWPIVLKSESWDRSRWPLPKFVFKHPVTGQYWMRHYSDDDLVLFESESPSNLKQAELQRYPTSGTWGCKAVETRLTRLLEANT